eukprot:1152252-Pelagomonas_calceolata.AAC.2
MDTHVGVLGDISCCHLALAKPPDVTAETWVENMNDCIIKVAGLELARDSEGESSEEGDDERRFGWETELVGDRKEGSSENGVDERRCVQLLVYVGEILGGHVWVEYRAGGAGTARRNPVRMRMMSAGAWDLGSGG